MSTLSQFFPAGGNIPSNAFPIELLVVGGGGSSTSGSGGAGGGRVIHIHGLYVVPGVAYAVLVGGATSLSSFAEQIIAPGGQSSGSSTPGGSGCGGTGVAGATGGETPGRYATPVAHVHTSARCYFGTDTRVLDLGNPGGVGIAMPANSLYDLRGGGGGAGSRGGDSTGTASSNTGFHNGCNGAGGAGYYCEIDGSAGLYGGGGNGYSVYATSVYASPPGAATGAGSANSGQGAGTYSANGGGSGVVIVAYSSSRSAASTTGSPSTPARTNYRVYRFTGSGSITFA